jgi:hypothetical protein
MNITPTAVFLLLLALIVCISLAGGYFGFISGDESKFGTEPPDSGWDLLFNAGVFFLGLLTFTIEGMPWIFGIFFWVMNIVALYTFVKIAWPGP